jgi:AcrR family transcriptional regulator
MRAPPRAGPGRGVAPGTGEQHDRRTVGVRPVGVHPRGRGRRLDIEFLGERVPRRVDHEERRRQIADALLRTAATRGLHATGMREVAAEAGVSLRLVQYYFGTKEELLLGAMQQLAARYSERALARIRRAGNPAGPRDIIAAILTEAVPADDERRTFTVLYTAYFALSLTDPALAIAPLAKNSGVVIDVVAAQLRAAQAAGDTPAGSAGADASDRADRRHGFGRMVVWRLARALPVDPGRPARAAGRGSARRQSAADAVGRAVHQHRGFLRPAQCGRRWRLRDVRRPGKPAARARPRWSCGT